MASPLNLVRSGCTQDMIRVQTRKFVLAFVPSVALECAPFWSQRRHKTISQASPPSSRCWTHGT